MNVGKLDITPRSLKLFSFFKFFFLNFAFLARQFPLELLLDHIGILLYFPDLLFISSSMFSFQLL